MTYSYTTLWDVTRFVGRGPEIEHIFSRLRNPEFESSSFVGDRRSGKTSLLNYLAHPDVVTDHGLDPEKFIFVYLDLGQITANGTPSRVYQLMLRRIASRLSDDELQTRLTEVSQLDTIEVVDLDELFGSLEEMGLHIVLLMDDFENIAANDNFSADFYYGLRSLAIHHDLALVIASRQNLAEISPSDSVRSSPFFNIFANIRLHPFSPDDIRQLLQVYMAESDFTFHQGDVEAITKMGGTVPFFLQMAFHSLHEAYSLRLSQAGAETPAGDGVGGLGQDMGLLEESFAESASPHLVNYWDNSSSDAQVLLTLLAVLANHQQRYSEKDNWTGEELRDWIINPEPILGGLANRGLLLRDDRQFSLASTTLRHWLTKELSKGESGTSSPEGLQKLEQLLAASLPHPTSERAVRWLQVTNTSYRPLFTTWLSEPRTAEKVLDLLAEPSLPFRRLEGGGVGPAGQDAEGPVKLPTPTLDAGRPPAERQVPAVAAGSGSMSDRGDAQERVAATAGQIPAVGPWSTVGDGVLFDERLPYSGSPLRPLMDLVAKINVSVHAKLLFGFLAGALLLLGMSILSLVVIARMNDRVEDLTVLQDQVNRADRMEYLITAQSHFRAMALLTNDDANNVKLAKAKEEFLVHLGAVEALNVPEKAEFFSGVREANDRFTASSAKVLGRYGEEDIDQALKFHIEEEHPVSHELEGDMRELQSDFDVQMAGAVDAFRSDRGLLRTVVVVFAAVSLALALLLGFVLSGSFVRPVRLVNRGLARIASGVFTERVEVPNRDEFGTLSRNLNHMSGQLAGLYQELQSVNDTLQEKVDEQVRDLDRASRLRQYLSPQIAESILGGTMDAELVSRRQNLTIFFSDIRGFTAMSERVEPEELLDLLNQYLTAMTEIVFKYGGTLDKYIGDAIMVFFGNPVPYEDHAERAVNMALEMRTTLARLQQRWFEENVEALTIGMGITTGYVTVGNIGSASRMEYTVLGNHVNLASRLADQAKPGQILISDRTLRAAHDLVDATEVDQIQLEGVSRPIKIYEIVQKEAVGQLA